MKEVWRQARDFAFLITSHVVPMLLVPESHLSTKDQNTKSYLHWITIAFYGYSMSTQEAQEKPSIFIYTFNLSTRDVEEGRSL